MAVTPLSTRNFPAPSSAPANHRFRRDSLEVLAAMARVYYEVVPMEYRTYCALTAAVSCRVLRHFGVDARVTPCQVRYLLPGDTTYLLGFLDRLDDPKQWNGHAVCLTPSHVVDGALHHYERNFGLSAPLMAITPRNPCLSPVYSQLERSDGSCLYWVRPPAGFEIEVPQEPPRIIADLAADLIRAMSRT